jgi:hypothetical protein
MKMVNWLTRAIITAAIMTSVSIATTWVMVNAYVQQLFKDFGQTAIVQPIALSDVLTALTSGVRGSNLIESTVKPFSAQEQEQGVSGEEEGTPAVGGSSDKEYPVPDHALPVMGQAFGEDFYISMDDLNDKKDSMTQEDRMEIFTLLITKLPPNEVQSISTLLENGITAEEMEVASGILQAYLSEDEYTKLLGILKK